MRLSVARTAALAALVAACGITCPVAASAQTVDEIVAKHIEARGGYERIKAIQTIRITRTVATIFSSIQVTTFKKRPNLLRVEQTPEGGTMSPRGSNDQGGWDLVQGKLMVLPDKVALERREIDADFDGLLVDWKQKGHTVTFEGTEPFGAAQAFKLKVTTKSGFVRNVFIDTKTYLEAGMSGTSLLPTVDPKTKELRTQTQSLTYSDFREVNGVMFPFSIDEDRTAGPITQSLATYTEKIEVNVPMDDTLFVPPTGK